MIIGHRMFDLRRKWFCLVEEKACAAVFDVREFKRVAENAAVGNWRVGENFRDKNFMEFFKPVIVGFEFYAPAGTFEVTADFHAS